MTPTLHSILIRLVFIVIFISATTTAYLLLPDESVAPIIKKTNATATPPVIPTNTKESLATIISPNAVIKGPPNITQDNKTTTAFTTSTENFQTATLTVDDKNYTLQFNAGDSLFTAMRRLETSSVALFSFFGKEYAGMGFFVNEINGIKNDASNNKFWIYYINGESAKIGISLYNLKQNDLINWKYEESKF